MIKLLSAFCLSIMFMAVPVSALVQPTMTYTYFSLIAGSQQKFPALDTIIHRPAPRIPPYGLYTWGYEYRSYRADIKQIGWKSIRMGGDMDDLTMQYLVQDTMEVMQTLGIGNRDNYPNDSVFLAAYLADVDAFLTKYGPGGTFFTSHPTLPVRPVQHVELWNEPNFQYMISDTAYTPRTELEAQRETLYTKLQTLAYPYIKSRWPSVQVVGFGAGGAASADLRFIQHVHDIDPTTATKYDILSTHPYVLPAPPEAQNQSGVKIAPGLAAIRAELDTSGAPNKTIWYTEIGWQIPQSEGGRYSIPASSTVPQRWAAAFITRLYALNLRLGVEKTNIMFVTDTDGFNGGFFNDNRTWRESATAVKTMVTRMPRPKLVGAIADGTPSNLFAYKFIADVNAATPETVIMAWYVTGPKKYKFALHSPSAVITDMLGVDTTITTSDTITLGPCPVYIKGGAIVGIGKNGDQAAENWLDGLSVTPNPFSAQTRISFAVSRGTWLTLAIYDCQGNLVKTMGYSFSRPGQKNITWDGRDEAGQLQGNGMYLFKFQSESASSTLPVMMVR
jgi:hypothetical protein